MKKQLKKNLKIALISLVLLSSMFAFYYYFLGGKSLAVFQPYAQANQVISIQGELYVQISSGSFPLKPTQLEWRWINSNMQIVKSGFVQLPLSVIFCLNQKITDTTSKLCTFSYDVTTPSIQGEYSFTANVMSDSTDLGTYIREYEFTRKLTVTNSAPNCKGDYTKTTQINIDNGIINKIEFIIVDQTTCVESVQSTSYTVNCNQNYVQQGTNEDAKCVSTLCNTNWVCTGYGDCSNNIKTRTCQDQNNCGVDTNKPVTTEVCNPTQCNTLVGELCNPITKSVTNYNTDCERTTLTSQGYTSSDLTLCSTAPPPPTCETGSTKKCTINSVEGSQTCVGGSWSQCTTQPTVWDKIKEWFSDTTNQVIVAVVSVLSVLGVLFYFTRSKGKK